jgi:uncharacterized protein YbcI
MSVTPQSVAVDLQDSHLLVTLRGAMCLAERAYASDDRARELLERLYSESFDTVKSALESAITEITHRPIERSRMDVDPLSGDAAILFTFGGAMPPQAAPPAQ